MYLLDSTIKHLNNRDLGIYYIVWSEIGSGFGNPGGTPPPRIPRSTPPPHPWWEQITPSEICIGSTPVPLWVPYQYWSRYEIIILLVQYIYKVNNFLEFCFIPLTYYCFCFLGLHRDTKMCRELVGQHGVKILNTFDSHGHTPLHWAALGGYSELIKFFLNCGVDVNRQSRSDYGPYPIHWACVNGHILCVDLLIQNGASIDCTDNKGCTPLIISAQYGKAMLAGYLIGKGAKSFFTDHEGDNALHWACFKGEHFLSFLDTE